MYAIRPLSVSMPPPAEGRNSGYLVVKGREDGDQTSCWGTCSDNIVWELPFPQNHVLKVHYSDGEEDIVLVPVPDQPLDSNRYYAVIATGGSRGLVRTCSREDMTVCCCRYMYINDVNPRPFDPADIYQQIEIVQCKRGLFTARAVAADGFPPLPYRYKGWRLFYASKKKFDLGEAPGLDKELRSRGNCHTGRPDPDAFPAPTNTTAVGRWYCPFYLIKEDGVSPRKQMDRSTFYEVMLQQRWEPVHALGGGGSKLASRKALIGGSVEASEESGGSSRHGDAYLWFRAPATGLRLGLCTSVWERMRWEEYRGGWVDEDEDSEKVTGGGGGSVIVERFAFKRMDGSVAVAFDFVHLNKVRGN